MVCFLPLFICNHLRSINDPLLYNRKYQVPPIYLYAIKIVRKSVIYLNIIGMMSLFHTAKFKTTRLSNEKNQRNGHPTTQYGEGKVEVFQSQFFQLLGFPLLWHLGFCLNQSSLQTHTNKYIKSTD